MKADIYQRITDQIVCELEKGIRPWLKPWNAEHASGRITRPLRGNGIPYRGINILMLWSAAMETRCPNACITARHRPIWTRAADDARILLREKRLSELQRVALRRDLDRIEAVLDGITKPTSPDPLARSSPI
jgi:hypothetical protein